jgi:hypothetical protein
MRAPSPESYYREVQVTFEICKDFRKEVVDQDGLIEDYWDAHSDHMALYRHNALIATYRIVRPVERKLPISEQEPSLAVYMCDRQIGRLVTSRNRLTLEACGSFTLDICNAFANYLAAFTWQLPSGDRFPCGNTW